MLAEKHWVCSYCGSISCKSISGGVVCARCGANFLNVAEKADVTNQLTKLISVGNTKQIGNLRKKMRVELRKQLVNPAAILAWCDKLKKIYPEDYLAGFYTAFFKDAVGKAEYKNYLEDPNRKIVYEPNVFLKEAMAFAIKHVDVTTEDLTNGFIEKICKQVNSHLAEREKELNCEDFKTECANQLSESEKRLNFCAQAHRIVSICDVSKNMDIAKSVREYLTEVEKATRFLADCIFSNRAMHDEDYFKMINQRNDSSNRSSKWRQGEGFYLLQSVNKHNDFSKPNNKNKRGF